MLLKCEASEGVSELEITHFATNDSQTIGVEELDDSIEPIIDTETLVVESGLETIDTEEYKIIIRQSFVVIILQFTT